MTGGNSRAKNLGWGGARGSGGLAIEAPRQPFRGSEVWGHTLGFGPSRGRGRVSLQHTPEGRASDFGTPVKGKGIGIAVRLTAIHS
jgi:hypothetical protein